MNQVRSLNNQPLCKYDLRCKTGLMDLSYLQIPIHQHHLAMVLGSEEKYDFYKIIRETV